jgi:hypothetical protein
VYYTTTSDQLAYAHFHNVWEAPVGASASAPAAASSSPSVVLEPSSGQHWAYYTTPSGRFAYAHFDGSWEAPVSVSGSAPASVRLIEPGAGGPGEALDERLHDAWEATEGAAAR